MNRARWTALLIGMAALALPLLAGPPVTDASTAVPEQPACSKTYPSPVIPSAPAAPGASATTVVPGPAPLQTPMPQPTVLLPGHECNQVMGKVPNSAVADAFANPTKYWGYGMLCQPNLPRSWWNVERHQLSLAAPNRSYHPIYNSLVWTCGCP
jgi:hypothetical protein